MAMSVAESHDGEPSDEQLLLRYRTSKDQAAFAILVRRHHQLVLGVCQQALGHRQDAEDAFQATFVVLAKDANRIRKPNALANWLYGVAYRISMQVRRQRARNRTVEVQDQTVDPTVLNPLDHLTRRYHQGVAYDELSRLPDRLRTPMILRYLSGKSNQEIATQLKLTEAAVEGRLKRAKAKLRVRLTGHGVTLAVALSMLQVETASADSTPLLESTIDQCLTHASTEPVTVEAAEIVQLANQEIIAMTTTSAVKFGIYGAAVVCATALTFTINPLTSSSWGADPGGTEVVEVQAPFGDGDSSSRAAGEVAFTIAQTQASGGEANPQRAGGDPFAESAGDAFTQPARDPFADGSNPAGKRRENLFGDNADADPFDAGPARGKSSRQRTFMDLKRRSTQELKIRSALGKETRMDFLDEPLSNAMNYVAQLHGVQIIIDKHALEDEGASVDNPINLQVSGIPLRNALNLLCRQLNLDYVLHDEVLLITSKSVAESMMETRVYPFRSGDIQQTQMLAFITSSIAPQSWSVVGGEGVIAAFPRGLIIRQTAKVHDEIAELIRQVSQTAPAAN